MGQGSKGKTAKKSKKGKGKSRSGSIGDGGPPDPPLYPPSASQKALLFSMLNALSISFQNQVKKKNHGGSDGLSISALFLFILYESNTLYLDFLLEILGIVVVEVLFRSFEVGFVV